MEGNENQSDGLMGMLQYLLQGIAPLLTIGWSECIKWKAKPDPGVLEFWRLLELIHSLFVVSPISSTMRLTLVGYRVIRGGFDRIDWDALVGFLKVFVLNPYLRWFCAQRPLVPLSPWTGEAGTLCWKECWSTHDMWLRWFGHFCPTGTRITTAIRCLRQAVLQEWVDKRSPNDKSLIGTMTHELLQVGLPSPEERRASRILKQLSLVNATTLNFIIAHCMRHILYPSCHCVYFIASPKCSYHSCNPVKGMSFKLFITCVESIGCVGNNLYNFAGFLRYFFDIF